MRAKSFLIALVAMMLPFMLCAETVEIDGIKYNLVINGKTAEVVGANRSGEINIPSSVNYQEIDYSVTSIGSEAFYGRSGLTSITIPNNVTSIGNYAFKYCTKLASVTIGNSVTSIGGEAFCGCSGLTSVAIPNSVTSIGRAAFYYCEKLASVTIGNSVTSIGGSAFEGCTSLVSITIPDGVTSIGISTFFGCSSLTSVTVGNSVTSISDNTFYNCTKLVSVNIPNSVTSIGGDAFRGCSSLTSVTIPNSVTSIGQSAFWGCCSLISATIGNSVTSIGQSAFSGCSSLTSVTIPNSVTSIGPSAFSGCSSLTSVTIGYNVTSIGYNAFYNCSGLNSVNISDLATWCKIEFGGSNSNPLYYAHNLYVNGNKIINLVIPNDVTSVKSDAFYNCSSLISAIIGNSVTSVGKNAFNNCTKLTNVELGKSVRGIGSMAFSNCENLTDIVCLAKSVPITSSDAFASSYIKHVSLHVYESSIEEYKKQEPWASFKTIVAADIPMSTLTYMIDGVVYKTIKYEEGETIIPEKAPEEEGYTFSGWEDLPEKMPGEDITVKGSFSINKYKLTYLVDGEKYKEYDIKFGSTIIPEPDPQKEGYTFSGWSEIPEEMPSHDVTITGTFARDPLGKCVSPAINIINGELVFGCEMDDVVYHYDIQHLDVKNGEGNQVKLVNTYRISVYASKDGYEDSDVTTKDFQFAVGKKGDVDGDGNVNAADVVQLTNIIISGTE